METRKTLYARGLPSPKLVIFAGSNARYSHSCARLSSKLGVPCANLGVAAGMGLDYLLASLDDVLKPGDFVYMPLEYDQYLKGKSERLHSAEAPELFYANKKTLWSLGIDRLINAAFSFDLRFAVSGAAEMALERVGFKRRTNIDTQNVWGDEISNTPENAIAYRSYIASLKFSFPERDDLAKHTEAKELIGRFLDNAHGKGITVVGGLPQFSTTSLFPPTPSIF